MGYRTTGSSLAEWRDEAPFIFQISDLKSFGTSGKPERITIDLTPLQIILTDKFLLNLRELIIDWRLAIRLKTIATYSRELKNLFIKINNKNIFYKKIDTIGEQFLLSIAAKSQDFKNFELNSLKRAFVFSPHSSLWEKGIKPGDFPKVRRKKGAYGEQIDRILAKALSRSTCVNILTKCEQAFESNQLDIGHFAFVNLAFAVFCRPESYRQITLADLIFDTSSNTYFLFILPAKSKVINANKICYRINETVGLLLQKQRQNVVEKYSHLVSPDDVEKLSLFPARRLTNNKIAWVHEYANGNFGMLADNVGFHGAYPGEIERTLLEEAETLGANALRHTIGTQLAQNGASRRTIQAVLKHATDNVCKAYIDIAYNGLIDVLSEAMHAPFKEHLPAMEKFRSKAMPINPAQTIRSEDLESGVIEITGECGKQIQCEFAPLSCYECNRFIPCWDADHSINLKIIQKEIDDFSQRGTAFQHMKARSLRCKYQIILVMNAIDHYKQLGYHGEKS
jgi:integrase